VLMIVQGLSVMAKSLLLLAGVAPAEAGGEAGR